MSRVCRSITRYLLLLPPCYFWFIRLSNRTCVLTLWTRKDTLFYLWQTCSSDTQVKGFLSLLTRPLFKMVAILSNAASILIITTVVYSVILLVTAILKFKRKSSILKQVPQLPAHWLWGHLRDVSINLLFSLNVLYEIYPCFNCI